VSRLVNRSYGLKHIRSIRTCAWLAVTIIVCWTLFVALSSWLQIPRSGFVSWLYHIFWEVVGMERGQLSLVSTTEELLGRKTSGSGLERREYGRRDASR
jgi:hypothetical protein